MAPSPNRHVARRGTALGLALLGLAPFGCSGPMTLPSVSRDVLPMLGLRDEARARAEAAPDLYALALERGHARAGSGPAKAVALEGTYAGRLRAAELAERNRPGSPGAALASRPERPAPADLALQPTPASRGAREVESGAPPLTAPGEEAGPSSEPGDVAEAGEPVASKVRSLVSTGQANLDPVSTYRVEVSRQERVGAVLQPAEEIVFNIRRDPKAVRIEWPSGPHKGREVIYSAEDSGLLHINMADAVVPLVLKLPIDSPRVRNSSRHPITEAGLDGVLANLAASAEAVESGEARADRLTCSGQETPEGTDRPCHKITRVTPEGETWVVYLDEETCWPVRVQANAGNGDLLERYTFANVSTNLAELADASAFAPEARWKKGGGLFERLARSGANRGEAKTANSSTR